MIKTTIKISNITCTNCASSIENHFSTFEDIRASVFVGPKKVRFEFDESKYSIDFIIAELHKIGYYPIINSNDQILAKKRDLFDLIIAIVFTLPLLWTMFAHIGGESLEFLVPVIFMNGWFQLVITIPVQFIAGRRFYKATFHQIKNKNLGMDSLVVLGTTAAFFYSLYITIFVQAQYNTASFIHSNNALFNGRMLFFETSAMVITMVLVGNYFENRVKEKTSDSLQALISLGSKEARVIKSGLEVMMPIEEVETGDTIVVLANEKIPLDGIVLNGDSYLDEKMMTGEPMPTHKQVGSKVIGSTMNLSSTLTIKVTAIGSETILAKIIETVEETALIKPKVQRIADKISKWFVPIVVVISIITLAVWLILIKTGSINEKYTVSHAIGSAIAVLVVSCPCALGLATPMSVSVSSGIAFENSILYRGGEFFELANKITAIAFDKTGTLTQGEPAVVKYFGDIKYLSYTKTLEKESNHPLAFAVMNYLESDILELEDFKVLIGKGISGKVHDKFVLVGSYNLIKELKITNSFEQEYQANIVNGSTIIFTVIDNLVVNMITIEDPLKDGILDVIKELKRRNIITHIITGDNRITAQYIADQIGITNIHAEVLPHEKADIVRAIQKDNTITAFVGDGINDAPALKMADISFAIGTGSDIAIDSADVTLMKHDLALVLDAIDLSKATIKNIYINFLWAFSYNIVLIPLAALNIIHPAFAGIGMGLSSILVVLNSLTLKLFKPRFKRNNERRK